MKYVKMNCEGSYRGQEYTPDTIIEVSDSLAESMILNSKGSLSTKELYFDKNNISGDKTYSEMTLDELSKIDFKKLQKKSLIEFANACDVKIYDENMKDIYELIITMTGFGADE